MRFFSYFYLENHMYFQDYVKYITIFVALIAMLFAASHYLRHRIETKYRDLSIILLLLIIFLLGVQYTYYTQSQNYANDTSRMVAFLQGKRILCSIINHPHQISGRSGIHPTNPPFLACPACSFYPDANEINLAQNGVISPYSPRHLLH